MKQGKMISLSKENLWMKGDVLLGDTCRFYLVLENQTNEYANDSDQQALSEPVKAFCFEAGHSVQKTHMFFAKSAYRGKLGWRVLEKKSHQRIKENHV